MIEPKAVTKKFFNKETEQLVGEYQLHLYRAFFDKYNIQLSSFKEKLSHLYNIRSEIVVLENGATEDISLLEIVQSDNKLLSKILASLGALCEELLLLIKEVYTDYHVSFIIYGEETEKGIANLSSISKVMDQLQRVSLFVDRARHVIILLLKQLCVILGKNLYNESSVTCFPEPLDYLAEMLVCLITLDGVCGDLLQEHWTTYRKAVRLMLHNPSQFQIPVEQLRFLKECTATLESKLLKGNIFQQTVEKCLEEGLTITIKNCSLANEIMLYILQMLTELEKDDDNMSFTQICLQVNAMYVLHYSLFGSFDKKIYKRLSEVNKKAAACVLVGNTVWHPEAFLVRHIPPLSKIIDIKTYTNNRLTLLATRSQNLPKEAHSLCLQVYTWMSELVHVTEMDMTHLQINYLQNVADTFINGIRLVKKISELVKWITNMHVDAERPMTKSTLLALCRLVEVLKAIQFIFQKNLLPLIYVITLITQHLAYKAVTELAKLKRSLTQEKFYKEQQLDVLSSLNVAERALKGPNTTRRLLIIKLALSASGLSSENLSDLRAVINRLEMMCSFPTVLYKLCNCSFLYWHQVLLPVYFSKMIDTSVDLSRFYLLFDSLNDCSVIAEKKVQTVTYQYLKSDIIDVMNQLVETNLRLQTHLHLQLPPSDPFQNPPPSNFKNLLPAFFNNHYIHIKEEVEHYLSTMFYNLTTVVLHDWRTYGEMRRLAMLQYGLNTVEDNLPIQTLEQGLDVLEIMRNINVFVVKYSYNLNNQFFIEDQSNNKHLNTINILHVANSIRTHGIGIMNTTVNFIYQFLQQKFFTFSQFMFDEQIKSRLLKDLKFFTDNKNESQMYPYERAEKFNVAIRRLGLNQEGLSYLDLFRKLITRIGNAMGYIRMIRSGGRRCLADATCFIPDLKAISDLNKLLEHENLSEPSKKRIESFASSVNNLVENFEEATEYFKLLVKVFIPTLRNSQNVHLKNFYIIVPPLTVNFVEHLFNCKERLNKKNRGVSAFTDDGFAMGLAFIIKLLNQSSPLNSLHWFQSVQAKHKQDRAQLDIQKTLASKEDDKLQHTLALTEKRLNAFEKEFRLLFYSFNSCRIFFE
ncbi:hypothetical protein PPYR_05908 [Photinus pyralis]|uniref:WASH complex subunit 4 n=2 Tax=Photinus pyralis TaxID=7054 RepID=A0A1Y1M7W4_PHOPY|nr:WASH complex subunit 4 isoform X1 [Photinus pyralis]KAB0801554.1 hypothetical protein PPYR_05908 [Photinus pyralis]